MNAAVRTEKPKTHGSATAATPIYVAGRREFLKYRELGVTEATNGRMRAQVTEAKQGLSK